MSINQLADAIEARCPSLTAIKKLMGDLSPEDRLYLLAYVESRPDLFGEILILPRDIVEREQGRIVKYSEILAQQWEENDRKKRKLDRQRNCEEARKKTPLLRKEAIDKAFDAKITKRRMYKFMCEYHPELLPSRKRKNGKNDPFMTEEKMWESYYSHGGNRH